MEANLKDLLLFMAKNLVDNPDDVFVEEVERDDAFVLELRVAKEDMGKVIGRSGRTAKDLRTIIRAASKDARKVHVDIVD